MTARVEIDIDPFGIHVLEIVHPVGPCLEQESFLDPDRNELRRRHHDIEAVAAGPDLGKCRVVRVVVGNRNLDVVGFFELLHEIGIGVIPPVEDVELAVGERDARPGDEADGDETTCEYPAHLHFCLSFGHLVRSVQIAV